MVARFEVKIRSFWYWQRLNSVLTGQQKRCEKQVYNYACGVWHFIKKPE
jgi:hypothetical protein